MSSRELLPALALALFLVLSGVLPGPASAQVVQYDITDVRGGELPSKITFLTPDGKVPEKLDVKSRVPEFAARKNVVYQLYGKGEIPLPAGAYKVYVSRGMEWSIAVLDIRVSKDRPTPLRAALERVVDTRGYISGDLHLHTKTFSGHGDANVEERIITLCAENLEWAVATDHNYITDYRLYARRLGADRWLKTTVGNEVTTYAVGHFNTFPLDPKSRPVNHRIIDPRVLFRRMRANPLEEIIQINHPRWVGVTGGYFRELDLSLGGGDPDNTRFAYDFDCLEVLNDNTISGWELAMLHGNQEPAFDHPVRDDWFNLLNRGFSYAGVGNSDSHEVDVTIAGCPRNYILSSTDDPGRAVETELVRAVRAKQVTVSVGIFVTMTRIVRGGAAGAGLTPGGKLTLGSLAPSGGREVELEITVQAAPWIDADRMVVIGNGEPVFEVDLPPPPSTGGPNSRPVIRFRDTVRLRPAIDTWYVAYAAGDEPPYPMLHRISAPLGFTNPIWVDVNGDGRFTPLRELAAAAVAPAEGERRLGPGEIGDRLAGTTPSFRKHAIAALSTRAPADRAGPLAELLLDPDGGVRQAAAMALSELEDRRAVLSLLDARESASSPWERFVFNRELVKAGDLSALEDIRTRFDKAEGLELFQMRRDLKELCRKNRIARWWVAGPFPSRSVSEGLAAALPPEREIDYRHRYRGFERTAARWRRHSTGSDHYLNLRSAFQPDQGAAGYAHLTVRARRPLRTCLLLGSKCGLEVLLNGRSIYRQESAKTSSAATVMLPVAFRAGNNSLLVKAVVEKGEWGFSLMVIDTASDLEFRADQSSAPPRQSF